jgi:hypothetical protein
MHANLEMQKKKKINSWLCGHVIRHMFYYLIIIYLFNKIRIRSNFRKSFWSDSIEFKYSLNLSAHQCAGFLNNVEYSRPSFAQSILSSSKQAYSDTSHSGHALLSQIVLSKNQNAIEAFSRSLQERCQLGDLSYLLPYSGGTLGIGMLLSGIILASSPYRVQCSIGPICVLQCFIFDYPWG